MIKYRHVLVWCLILALLICLNCNPLIISASATTAFVDIALNYENIASVPAELVPFVLLLVAVQGVDYFFDNIDELIAAAEDLSDRCSAVTRKWAVSVADKIKEGISKFYLSEPYVQDINSQLTKGKVKSDSYLVIPGNLLGIGYLSSDEIIVPVDVPLGPTTGTTTEPTTGPTTDVQDGVLSGIQDHIIDLKNAISSLSSTFVDRIGRLQTAVSTIRVNLVNDLGEISTRVNGLTQSVVSKLQSVSNVLDSSINDVKTSVQVMRTNLVDGLADLSTKINSMTQSVVSKLESVSNVLDSSINDVKTSVQVMRTNIVEGFAGLQNTVSQSFVRLGEMVVGLDSVESVTTGIKTSVSTMRTNLVDGFSALKDSVADGIKILRDRLAVGVDSISAGVGSLVESVATFPQTFKNIYDDFTDALGEFLTNTIALPLEDVRTRIEEIAEVITEYFTPDPNEEDKNHVVVDGINSGIGYFGHSNGILSKYGAGFLAATSIFNLFADIPIFSDLLVISISIGLVGAFLGMVLNVSRSDAAGRKQKVGAD